MCSNSSFCALNSYRNSFPQVGLNSSLSSNPMTSLSARLSKEDSLFNKQVIEKHLTTFKVDELGSNIRTLEETAEKLDADIDQSRGILINIQSKLAELNRLLTNKAETIQRIDVANERLGQLHQQIKDISLTMLDQVMELSSSISNCGEEIQQLKTKQEEIDKQISKYLPREDLINIINKKQEHFSQLENNRNVTNEKIQTFKQEQCKIEALKKGIKVFKSLYLLDGRSLQKKVLSETDIPFNLEVLKQDQRCVNERIEKTEAQGISLREQTQTIQSQLTHSEGSLNELENTKKQIELKIDFIASKQLLTTEKLNGVRLIMQNKQREIAALDLPKQANVFQNLTTEINSQINNFNDLETQLETHNRDKTELSNRQREVAIEIHALNLKIVEIRKAKETVDQEIGHQQQELSTIKKQRISLKNGIACLEKMQEENTIASLPALIPPKTASNSTSISLDPAKTVVRRDLDISNHRISTTSSSSSAKKSPTKRTRNEFSDSSSTNNDTSNKIPRALTRGISGENLISMDDTIPDFVTFDFSSTSFHHFITSSKNLTLKNIEEFLTTKTGSARKTEINKVEQGCAPIHLLIQRCDSDADVDLLVEFMSKYKPDCTIKAQDKWLPIDLFSTCEDLNHETRAKKIIVAFQRLGVSLEGSGIIKPLNLSICQEYNIIASALIEAGVSIRAYDHWGLAPIHYIAISGNLEMLKLFKISHHSTLNQICEVRHANPLIYACNYARKDCVNFLLNCKNSDAYVDIDLKDHYNQSCLDYVERPFHTDGKVPERERENREKIIKNLLSYGVGLK